MKFTPKCANDGKLAYVSADGYFRPCCWRPFKDETFDKDEFNLSKVTLDEAVKNTNTWLKELIKKDIDNIDHVCKVHCVFNLASKFDGENERL